MWNNHDGNEDWPINVIASQRVGAKRRPMTGSAKRSIPQRKESMDCFVARAPRNDGCKSCDSNSNSEYTSAFLRQEAPEVFTSERAPPLYMTVFRCLSPYGCACLCPADSERQHAMRQAGV